eukprot:224925_1
MKTHFYSDPDKEIDYDPPEFIPPTMDSITEDDSDDQNATKSSGSGYTTRSSNDEYDDTAYQIKSEVETATNKTSVSESNHTYDHYKPEEHSTSTYQYTESSYSTTDHQQTRSIPSPKSNSSSQDIRSKQSPKSNTSSQDIRYQSPAHGPRNNTRHRYNHSNAPHPYVSVQPQEHNEYWNSNYQYLHKNSTNDSNAHRSNTFNNSSSRRYVSKPYASPPKKPKRTPRRRSPPRQPPPNKMEQKTEVHARHTQPVSMKKKKKKRTKKKVLDSHTQTMLNMATKIQKRQTIIDKKLKRAKRYQDTLQFQREQFKKQMELKKRQIMETFEAIEEEFNEQYQIKNGEIESVIVYLTDAAKSFSALNMGSSSKNPFSLDYDRVAIKKEQKNHIRAFDENIKIATKNLTKPWFDYASYIAKTDQQSHINCKQRTLSSRDNLKLKRSQSY